MMPGIWTGLCLKSPRCRLDRVERPWWHKLRRMSKLCTGEGKCSQKPLLQMWFACRWLTEPGTTVEVLLQSERRSNAVSPVLLSAIMGREFPSQSSSKLSTFYRVSRNGLFFGGAIASRKAPVSVWHRGAVIGFTAERFVQRKHHDAWDTGGNPLHRLALTHNYVVDAPEEALVPDPRARDIGSRSGNRVGGRACIRSVAVL